MSPKIEVVTRNVIFGVEDGLVSTLGLLAGVAVAGVPRATILLTGLVLIFVEAFSMGIGSMLTEHSVEEFQGNAGTMKHRSFVGGIVMLVSYLVAGMIPLAPYVFLSVDAALWVSMTLALVSLFTLGAVSAFMFHARVFRHGVEMLFLGGAALAVGVIVGRLMNGLNS